METVGYEGGCFCHQTKH